MRVIGFCFARNEQDIIEAFVRHTLVYCDELILLDHGSTDATAEILRHLKKEGLPIHLLSDPEIGLAEPGHIRRLFCLAAHEFSADWILGLDADEFIDGAPGRSFLPGSVAHETPCLKFRMRNYYARPDDRADVLNPVERITHRPSHEKWDGRDLSQFKVVVPGWMVREEGGDMTMGKHQYLLAGQEAPFRVLDDAWLAHFSLRSPGQYAAKLVSKQINKYHHIPLMGDDVSFYDAPYEVLRGSYSEFADHFYTMRLPWHEDGAGRELVCDPARYRGGPLRYTPQKNGSDLIIRDLLDFSERLARLKKTDCSPAGMETQRERQSLGVASHPTPGHRSMKYLPADTSNYQTICLPLDCPADATGLNFCFNTGPGMLEIRRIELSCTGNPAAGREYDGKSIQSMIRAVSGGACIASFATQRLLVSRLPLHLIFSGWKDAIDRLPDEVTIEFRHETGNLDHVCLSAQVLEMINVEHNQVADASAHEGFHPYGNQEQKRLDAVCQPGVPVDFSGTGTSQLYKAGGWSSAEPWGSWTDGSRAILRFTFAEIPEDGLEMAVLARTIVCPGHPPMTVEVKLNGEPAATWQYKSDQFDWRKVLIPSSIFKDLTLEVAFEIKEPLCPVEMKLSADTRRLGIAVSKVGFQPPARGRRPSWKKTFGFSRREYS